MLSMYIGNTQFHPKNIMPDTFCNTFIYSYAIKSLTLKLLGPIKGESPSHLAFVSIKIAENRMSFVLLARIVRFYVDGNQSTKVVNETVTGTVITVFK